MFSAALPCGTILSLVCNYYEIKSDALKFITEYRRPFPRSCEDIGIWQSIFEFLGVAAVITNAAIISFTMDIFSDSTIYFRFWFFIILQWVVFALRYIIQEMVPDVPSEVELQLERAAFINRKFVLCEPDPEPTDSSEKHEILSKNISIKDETYHFD